MTKRVTRCAWCHKRIDGEFKTIAGVFKVHAESCYWAVTLEQSVAKLPQLEPQYIGDLLLPDRDRHQQTIEWVQTDGSDSFSTFTDWGMHMLGYDHPTVPEPAE